MSSDGDSRAPYLSVVAPLFDEAECAGPFVAELVAEVRRLGRPFELVCVDDGSRDATRARLLALKATVPELRVLALDAHRGISTALRAGVLAARGEVIATIDADLQNNPADLAMMLRALEGPDRPDCVAGFRRQRRDDLIRRTSALIANAVAARLTRAPTRDAGCALRVFRADVLRGLPPFHGMHRFLPTLVELQGGRVVEVAVDHRPRLAGRSRYGNGLGRTVPVLLDALGVRWMLARRLRYDAEEL
jgi:glycosyltransferase involved in cell wall biosynthesis